MSYFKKFTDFCAGVAAFVCGLYLIRQYMQFEPFNVEENAPSKLTQFFKASQEDYIMLVALVFLLVLSVAISVIFRKLPYVGFTFSIIPTAYICFMFESKILYEQKALFLVASALHVIGNLVECIFRDKEDGGHRLFIASKLSFIMGALCCFYMKSILEKPKPEKLDGLNTFQKLLFFHNGEFNVGIISTLGWMMLTFAVIGILLYNVYFIDAILSLVSLGYVIIKMTFEKLTFLPFFFLALVAIAATSNILLAVFENNLSKREQRRSR